MTVDDVVSNIMQERQGTVGPVHLMQTIHKDIVKGAVLAGGHACTPASQGVSSEQSLLDTIE